MEIIRESNQNYIKFLGPNEMDESKEQRLLKYLMVVDIDNGKAIFNMMTRAFIFIPNDQFEKIYCRDRSIDYIDWLWGNYFLVNDDFNEAEQQQKLKINHRRSCEDPSYLAPGKISDYTIFSTMACNARCEYCYEKGRPQLPMKAETARKVGEYIVKNSVKNGQLIQLRWFGGEPLVNENAIDIICQIVKDAGYNYASSFTSNGFLFKEEKLDKYKNLWHLVSGQITIDGTEENYNKIKNYKNAKGKSPYQIVMNNVKMLLDNNIHIAIRMNMDASNADNIKELIRELYERFHDYKNINPYCYPIFEYEYNPRTPEENEVIYTKLKEIDDILYQYGWYNGEGNLPDTVKATHCMIDNGHAVVIGTQGDIGLCEHYSDDNFWGHIDKPEMKDLEVIKSFKTYMKNEELCKDCPMLPSCLRPMKCEDLKMCNIFRKEWYIRRQRDGVRFMYLSYKNNIKNNPNEPIKCWNHEMYENKFIPNNTPDNINKEIEKEVEKKGFAKFLENILILIGLK